MKRNVRAPRLKVNKPASGKSGITANARAILARTAAAQATIDAYIGGRHAVLSAKQ